MNLDKNLSAPPQTPGEVPFTPSTLLAKVAVGLALLTFVIFMPLVGYTFVNYDDELFTTNNPKVAPGLTWEGVKWAFTSADIDYWRPLSWLSHMLDFELFGVAGGLHHLTSLLIHIAATVTLLLALHRLTGSIWRSAMVAALFAWHPLHVESVAWIAERKDVLCGFFWFYTIWAYARYVERPEAGRYAQVLAGFVLGAMSKPMIVTLPCVLLLLDFWPLRRINLANFWGPAWRAELRAAWPLLKEKIPLFAGVVALSLSAVTSQREVGTLSEHIPLFAKVATVAKAYTTYLGQTFWPLDLCVLYPLTPEAPSWKWFGAVALIVGLTIRCLFSARRFPFLAVGWLWFLGVLVPVVGIVQVGEQAHADRYTYVPLVGLFLLLVWWAATFADDRPRLRRWLAGGGIVMLTACAIVTRSQLRHWENSVELFKHAVAVNPKNLTAYNNIAAELMHIGRGREAIPYLEQALSVRLPGTTPAESNPALLWNLGLCHWQEGNFVLARRLISDAFRLEPSHKKAAAWLESLRKMIPPEAELAWKHKYIAAAQAARRDYVGAAAALAEAIRIDPTDMDSRVDRAAFLAAVGQDEAAVTLLRETVQLSPTNALAQSNLGGLLARKGRLDEAIVHYRIALQHAPANPDTRHNLALALARNHRPLEAIAEFETVLRLKQDHQPALEQLAWLLATRAECRNPSRALSLARLAVLAKPSASSLDVAAAANAANGNYQEAAQLAAQALPLARAANLSGLEAAIRARLQLYEAGQPYTQPASKDAGR